MDRKISKRDEKHFKECARDSCKRCSRVRFNKCFELMYGEGSIKGKNFGIVDKF